MTNSVTIMNTQECININSNFPVFPNFQNFSILATVQGQTAFSLPSNPLLTGLMSVNIEGVTQDPLAGDYTISGNIITFNAGLNIGTKIAGFYQVLSQVPSGSFLNYQTFFFTATQGQQAFYLGFVPQAIIYVAINGVIQPSNSYTINGQIITMSAGLNAGDGFFGLTILS